MKIDRQSFLEGSAAAVVTTSTSGVAAAPAPATTSRILRRSEVLALEALGETLVPGAREAGIARYVDSQLAVPPRESLLMVQYFDQPAPYLPFYRDGLAALDGASRKLRHRSFAALSDTERDAIVRTLSTSSPPGWSGPPGPLFYLALRGDAMDVVYGTIDGFRRLGIPYMPHVVPAHPW